MPVKSTYGNKCYSAIPAISKVDVLISDPKGKENLFNDSAQNPERATSMTSMRSCYGVFADQFIFKRFGANFEYLLNPSNHN